MTNLLSNATKYSPKEGTVQMRAETQESFIRIAVTDNGPGIPLDLQEQVFFPMVSSKEDGSGLGLSISQDIIRIHGGAILFNTASKGTTFSILIPINLESKNEDVKSA